MGKFDEFLKYVYNEDFKVLFEDYKNIALTLFKWSGDLPVGLSSERIEEYLFDKGQMFFFNLKDKQGIISGLVGLPCSNGGNFDIYDEPIDFIVSGRGFSKVIKASEGVLLKNNPLKIPTAEIVKYYCRKLNNIETAKDMNINALKTPFILKVNGKETQLTLQNFFNQVACSKQAIVLDKSLSMKDIECFQTGVQCNLDKFTDDFNNYENKLLTKLGIDNNNVEKAERLVTDEVHSNDEIINDNVAKMLEYRQKFCDELNKKFNINISVEFTGIKEPDVVDENDTNNTIPDENKKEVENNE